MDAAGPGGLADRSLINEINLADRGFHFLESIELTD